MELFKIIYIALIPFVVMGLMVFSFCYVEPAKKYRYRDLLFFTILVRLLQKKLNKTVSVIITVIFSVVFAPAVAAYLVWLGLLAIAEYIVNEFSYAFKWR
jgi:hypothetical protein